MEKNNIEEKPPFFKSWDSLYFIVIASLMVYIILFYLFTIAFS